MTPLQLESAVFWEQKICLSCEALNESDAEECEACGSPDVADADLVARCVAVVREEEE